MEKKSKTVLRWRSNSNMPMVSVTVPSKKPGQ